MTLAPAKTVAALVAGTLALLSMTASAAAPPSLHDVDWDAVLAADAAVLPWGGCIPPRRPEITGPCVRVPLAVPVEVNAPGGPYALSEAAGRALTGLDDVVYGDLDGDGQDEALLHLDSGGTAGDLALLVYQAAEPAPWLVAALPGYRISGRISGSALIVNRPYYFDHEGNCCPTARIETINTLRDGALQTVTETMLLTGEREQVVSLDEATVVAFYHAIGQGRFEEAYAFLSPRFQQSQPFETWHAGYAATERLDVLVQRGGHERQVTVAITATDRLPDGTAVIRRYDGWWVLTWDAAARRWLLDEAVIE